MSRRDVVMLLAAALLAGCQGRVHTASALDAPKAVPPAQPTPPEPTPTAPVAGGGEAPAAAPEVLPASGVEDAGVQQDPTWRVKDNKVRCVRAPCPTLDAIPVNSSDATAQVVEVELSGLGLSPKEEQQLLSRVYGDGLRVKGRVEERADTRGRPYKVLKATGLAPQ